MSEVLVTKAHAIPGQVRFGVSLLSWPSPLPRSRSFPSSSSSTMSLRFWQTSTSPTDPRSSREAAMSGAQALGSPSEAGKFTIVPPSIAVYTLVLCSCFFHHSCHCCCLCCCRGRLQHYRHHPIHHYTRSSPWWKTRLAYIFYLYIYMCVYICVYIQRRWWPCRAFP